MTLGEIMHGIEALPKREQLQLLEHLSALTEEEVPASLHQSMAEADRGELMDLDEALKEVDERR